MSQSKRLYILSDQLPFLNSNYQWSTGTGQFSCQWTRHGCVYVQTECATGLNESPAEVLTHHLAYKAKVWSRHRWQAMPQAPCQQYCGLIVTQHPHTHKWQCSSYGDLATVTSNSTLIFPALPHCHGDSPSHNLHGDCPSHNLHWTVPVIIYNGDSPSHNLHAEVSFHWFLSFNTSRQFSPFLKHRAACSLPLSKPVSTVVCAVTGCNSTSRHTK